MGFWKTEIQLEEQTEFCRYQERKKVKHLIKILEAKKLLVLRAVKSMNMTKSLFCLHQPPHLWNM